MRGFSFIACTIFCLYAGVENLLAGIALFIGVVCFNEYLNARDEGGW